VPVSDEFWRVNIDLSGIPREGRRRSSSTLADDLRHQLADDIRVSSGKTRLYLYGTTADAARRAAHVVEGILAQHRATAEVRLEYWDLPGQTWNETASGSPDDAAAGPHAALEAVNDQERRRSARTGIAAWQVRVELPTHAEVKALAQRLTSEGWPVIQRRKYLVAGADCEQDAEGLALEIQGYSSAAAAIRVRQTVFAWDPSPGGLQFGP
jgi:hypothetical protein